MPSKRRRFLPRQFRDLSFDLGLTLAIALLTPLVVFLPGVRETPLRPLAGILLVLFAPGWAIVTALFPADEAFTVPDGYELVTRGALALATSIGAVAAVGIVGIWVGSGITVRSMVTGIVVVTAVSCVTAQYRRRSIPPEERFAVSPKRARARFSEWMEYDSQTDLVLNVFLVVMLVTATATVAYAVTVPKDGQSYTEFHMLPPDGVQGSNFSEEAQTNGGSTVVIGVHNNEFEATEYSVIVEYHDVSIAGDTARVESRRAIDQFEISLDHNQSWQRAISVPEPRRDGNWRLTAYLYRGQPDRPPTFDSSYRSTRLWYRNGSLQSPQS